MTFEFGLRMFALDPVVVIFFKKCEKNYKSWIKCISKKLQQLDQQTLVIFFEKASDSSSTVITATPFIDNGI